MIDKWLKRLIEKAQQEREKMEHYMKYCVRTGIDKRKYVSPFLEEETNEITEQSTISDTGKE